jgi:hypothetical protein
MPWVGFEPKITASERAKTVHALDRSATLIDHEHSKGVLFVSTLWSLSERERESKKWEDIPSTSVSSKDAIQDMSHAH